MGQQRQVYQQMKGEQLPKDWKFSYDMAGKGKAKKKSGKKKGKMRGY